MPGPCAPASAETRMPTWPPWNSKRASQLCRPSFFERLALLRRGRGRVARARLLHRPADRLQGLPAALGQDLREPEFARHPGRHFRARPQSAVRRWVQQTSLELLQQVGLQDGGLPSPREEKARCDAVLARDGADRHARLERLRNKAGLILEPPPPPSLRPTQNLDPHRPDLMTLMLALRSDPPLRITPPQGGPC